MEGSHLPAVQGESAPSEQSMLLHVQDNQDLQVGSVNLYGCPVVSMVIGGQERLCLAQISNLLLKQFSYNEIHNRRVALGITCIQCTPVQLEILRRAGAMPVSSRRCGMITRREAERLCKSFLGDNAPPRLPEDFAFLVHHECAWGCRGAFIPSRYNSSRAKCIKCTGCGVFFSPNKFIFHSHCGDSTKKYIQPDAANFNSWRRHLKLTGNPPEEVVYAWEDVKAMFNGGTRKRIFPKIDSSSSTSLLTEKQSQISVHPQNLTPGHKPLINFESGSVRMPQESYSLDSKLSSLPATHVIDYVWHQQQQISVSATKAPNFCMLTYLPWLTKKKNFFSPRQPMSLADEPEEKKTLETSLKSSSHCSAFHPVVRPTAISKKMSVSSVPVTKENEASRDDNTDDEVDIESLENDCVSSFKFDPYSISKTNTTINFCQKDIITLECWSPPRETEKEAKKFIRDMSADESNLSVKRGKLFETW